MLMVVWFKKDDLIMFGCCNVTHHRMTRHLITKDELINKYQRNIFNFDDEVRDNEVDLSKIDDGEEVSIYIPYKDGKVVSGCIASRTKKCIISPDNLRRNYTGKGEHDWADVALRDLGFLHISSEDNKIDIITELHSSDGITTKFIQNTMGLNYTETTYVNYHNKHIICYSTQIGCNNKCVFCANGMVNNFVRHLSDYEIIHHIDNVVSRCIKTDDEKPILFSAMGIGDPLSNYSTFIRVVKDLYERFPNSKFAMATSCQTNCLCNINNLTYDIGKIPMKLTISLHSAIKVVRDKLMPVSYRELDDIIDAAEGYRSFTGNPVEYNVVLLNDVNDHIHDAKAIVGLFERHRIIGKALVKINTFNNVPGCEYKQSQNVDEFVRVLKMHGIPVERYSTDGTDINAACGQLSSKNEIYF